MLYMTHKRLDAVVASSDKQHLMVQIRDYSKAGLIGDKLQLVWRTPENPKWSRVRLERAAKAHTFQAIMEGLRPGQSVEYYLTAASRSGRQESLPRTAPNGCYAFKVENKR
jgi:hypothetical protein